MTDTDLYDEDEAVPELDEVQQWEPEASVLDVDVRGPVQVHQLPARIAVMHSVVVDTTPTQLFGRDLRRARALVWATAAAVRTYHLGTRKDEVLAETAAQAVATDGTAPPQTLEFRHCEPVYAKAETDTVTISFVLEQWAD